MGDLLEVKDLKVAFRNHKSTVTAIDSVSFSIKEGEVVGVVGESGCGKSVTSLSVLRLLPSVGEITAGEILFRGEDLVKKTSAEMCDIRGNSIAMIFQDPMTSLNPVMTIEKQLMETIITHQKLDKAAARSAALEMLRKVGIPSPEKRMKEFPHQLSGGMRQRVMIAMALSCNPKLLIADEPTTALDVTVQAQILELMRDLKRNYHTAIMLITHDLGVVAEMADHIAVMYAGKILEYADAKSLFENPLHPYTQGLMKSIPSLDEQVESLYAIPGTVPRLDNMPKGCRFCERCTIADKKCMTDEPPVFSINGHNVRCWKYESEGCTDA